MPADYSTRTSGDLIADRRFAYGEAALEEGDFIAARDLFAQVIEVVPGWPPAHFQLAKALSALGENAAAGAALAACLALDPSDRLGAGMLQAQRAAAPPSSAAMPDAYVAALFDEYAPRFDRHLTGVLAYRAPEMLRAALERHGGRNRRYDCFLDLGCGSGLMARALEGRFGEAVGVDLSAGMLREAVATKLYTRLECTPLHTFLDDSEPAMFDLVVAADVFCYVPELAPVFAGVARVLRPGGHFAFTIQTHGGEGAIVGADARVHHAPALVHRLVEANGFEVLEAETVSTRKDRGEPVPGALFLLAKP